MSEPTIKWFQYAPAEVARFDKFSTENPELHFYVRGAALVAGVNSDDQPVGKDGKVLEALSHTPWTPEEQQEMEESRAAYIRSMSCDPEEWK